MDRRRFLELTTIAGAAALLARSLPSSARAQEPPRTTSLATLSEAFRAAQRLGKPLLVLVVPADRAAQWQAGEAFGELLNHGGDEVLADLALAHLACATMTDLRVLVPGAPAGEPTMVLVETDRIPSPAHALPLRLPFPTLDAALAPDDAATEHRIDERIAALSQAVHVGLAASPAMLAERARVARAHLDAGTLSTLATALATGRVQPALADRAAALVREAIAAQPASRTQLFASLVAGVTARVRSSRIPGSVWAHSSCGVDIEGEESQPRPCGMAMMPERSARFLYFYLRG